MTKLIKDDATGIYKVDPVDQPDALVAGNVSWRDLAKNKLQVMLWAYTTELAQYLNEMTAEKTTADRPRQGDDLLNFYAYNPRKEIYWAAIALYAGLQVVVSIVAIFVLIHITYLVNIGLLVLIAQAVHFGLSLKRIRPDKLAGIELVGRPVYKPATGLYIVVYGIMKLYTASRNYKDVRFPGPPEQIFRVSVEQQNERAGGDAPPQNFLHPILVTTGEPRYSKTESRSMNLGKGSNTTKYLMTANPLDEQLNIEVQMFGRYRPHQDYGGIFRIIRNLSADTIDLDDEIRDLMREQFERDIKTIISTQTYATIIENFGLVNQVFEIKVSLSLLRIGIQIAVDGAGINDISPSHETNEEQQKVARARFAYQQAIIKAEQDKETAIRQGAGAAKAEELFLQSLAKGYKEIMNSTGASGEAVIASETAKKAIGDKAQVILGAGGGTADILGSVLAGTKIYEGMKKSNES